MKSELVSVIIPTRNRGKELIRAIESVLNQTYKNVEVIIVDDGSRDNTYYLLKTYLKKENVKYIKHETRKGAQAARITGIRKATGEYIAFLDSDDELLQNSLEVRLTALRNSNFDNVLVYGDVWVESGNKKRIVKFKKLVGYAYTYLVKELTLCPCSVMMINRECFDVSGYPDVSFPSWQDDDIVLTIGKHFPLLHCGYPIAIMHSSDVSITKNRKTVAQGCKSMVSKYEVDIVKYHGNFRLFLWYLRISRSQILAKYQRVRLKLNRKNAIFLLPYAFGLRLIQALLTKYLKSYFDHIYG